MSEVVEQRIMVEKLYAAIKFLSEKDAELIRALYVDEVTEAIMVLPSK